MKANHIPREIRLQRRIDRLNHKLDGMWVHYSHLGFNSPYLMCKFCGISMPQSNGVWHFRGCQGKGLVNEINYYRSLLADEQQTNYNSTEIS